MLPFRAWGEISPDKNTDRHDTTAGFTPPLLGHWSFAISCPLAPNGTAFSIRFLFVGSSFRFPLPSHARSPSRSCGSLPFEWPLQGRTCTSKSVPMLGVQQKGPAQRRGLSVCIGVPKGIRTPVAAVKGQCPRPLDDGDRTAVSRDSRAVTRESPSVPGHSCPFRITDHESPITAHEKMVELAGIEPATSCMPCKRSPS